MSAPPNSAQNPAQSPAQNPVRVAHTVNPYLPSSMTWVYSQLVALREGGKYEPIVLTKRLENTGRFPWEPVYAIEDLPFWKQLLERRARKRGAGYFPYHEKVLREQKPRLLHSHMGDRGMEDAALARAVGLFHVTTFYGADIWVHSQNAEWRVKFKTWAEEVGSSGQGLFLVEGSAMRNRVLELGAAPETVLVSHLGVDLNRIPFEPRSPGANGEVRLILAGRPIEKKGHVYGLRAFALLAKKYPQVHLDLLIGGRSGQQGPIVDELNSIIAAEKLEERIRWDDFLPYDEYLQRLRQGHIFVQPSVHARNGDAEGGFPVTILEMMASGMPVVASDHCDIPEAVLEGKTGFVVAQNNAEALAERLGYLVENPGLWATFGNAGREHVAAEYNIAVQGRALEAIYDRALGQEK